MNKAILQGLKIDHIDREWALAQYNVFARIFYDMRTTLGRKSFPGYKFTLKKILELRNIATPMVKLPVLVKTLQRMESDWAAMMEVYTRTIFRLTPREFSDHDFEAMEREWASIIDT